MSGDSSDAFGCSFRRLRQRLTGDASPRRGAGCTGIDNRGGWLTSHSIISQSPLSNILQIVSSDTTGPSTSTTAPHVTGRAATVVAPYRCGHPNFGAFAGCQKLGLFSACLLLRSLLRHLTVRKISASDGRHLQLTVAIVAMHTIPGLLPH